jgi:hypothetical protein
MHFNLNGKKFGFIPKLDDITFGENADLVKYINDKETFHSAMAVMYRPVTAQVKERYIIEEYEGSDKYADIMRNAPLSAFLGAKVFFYSLMTELQSCILSSLEEEVEIELTYGGLSQKNGEDFHKYINSLKEISEDLSKLTNLNYTSA